MKNNEQENNPQRNKYSPQLKEQAPERAGKDGMPKAAKDLTSGPGHALQMEGQGPPDRPALRGAEARQAEVDRLKRENARLTEAVAFLKKAAAYFRQGTPVKYATIQALEGAFAVGLMCRCLRVSRGNRSSARLPRASRPGKPWRRRSSGSSATRRAAPDRPGSPGGSRPKAARPAATPSPAS